MNRRKSRFTGTSVSPVSHGYSYLNSQLANSKLRPPEPDNTELLKSIDAATEDQQIRERAEPHAKALRLNKKVHRCAGCGKRFMTLDKMAHLEHYGVYVCIQYKCVDLYLEARRAKG